MKKDIRDYLGREFLFYDGGSGTYLQAHGLKPGELPEEWNLTNREAVTEMHESILKAGSHNLSTNTFGANPSKLQNSAALNIWPWFYGQEDETTWIIDASYLALRN